MKKVIFNDDASPLWDVQPGNAVNSLKELIDRVIDNVPVDIYTIECALPDMCEYQTKAGEVVGVRLGKEAEKKHQRLRGVRALKVEGTDHLSVYVDHLHSRNIKCLAEVRMSDTHHPLSADSHGCPLFTLEHQDWIIKRNDGAPEVAMDYSVPEVREHRLAIIRELIENYDIDGIELNFNRWGKHFNRNEAREKIPVMTFYVGKVREMLDAAGKIKGKKLLLGVWMMSTVEECLNAGCDPEAWVKNSWIDFLVTGDYNCTVPDLPIEQFAGFCKGRCDLYAQMGDLCGGVWRNKPVITGRGLAQDPGKTGYASICLDNAEARGAAKNHYHWGADGIAFWNIACCTGSRGKKTGPEQRARMFEWMNQAIDPEKVDKNPRIYHYLPLYKGMEKLKGSKKNYAVVEEMHSPMGAKRGQVLDFTDSDRKVFKFRMADGANGEPVNATLKFRLINWNKKNMLKVDINQHPIPKNEIKLFKDLDNVEIKAYWAEIKLCDFSGFKGDNEIGLSIVSATGVPYMEELIVEIIL